MVCDGLHPLLFSCLSLVAHVELRFNTLQNLGTPYLPASVGVISLQMKMFPALQMSRLPNFPFKQLCAPYQGTFSICSPVSFCRACSCREDRDWGVSWITNLPFIPTLLSTEVRTTCGPEIAPQGLFFPSSWAGFHTIKVSAEMRACGWLQLTYCSAAWGSWLPCLHLLK